MSAEEILRLTGPEGVIPRRPHAQMFRLAEGSPYLDMDRTDALRLLQQRGVDYDPSIDPRSPQEALGFLDAQDESRRKQVEITSGLVVGDEGSIIPVPETQE